MRRPRALQTVSFNFQGPVSTTRGKEGRGGTDQIDWTQSVQRYETLLEAIQPPITGPVPFPYRQQSQRLPKGGEPRHSPRQGPMSPKAAKTGKTTVRSLADQRSPMPAAAFDNGGDAKQPEKKLQDKGCRVRQDDRAAGPRKKKTQLTGCCYGSRLRRKMRLRLRARRTPPTRQGKPCSCTDCIVSRQYIRGRFEVRAHRPASSESGAAIGAATPNPTRKSAVSRLTYRLAEGQRRLTG